MLNQRSAGFTLIELVAVIVLLSILSVTAIPRLLDFKNDAELAVFESLGAALISAAKYGSL